MVAAAAVAVEPPTHEPCVVKVGTSVQKFANYHLVSLVFTLTNNFQIPTAQADGHGEMLQETLALLLMMVVEGDFQYF